MARIAIAGFAHETNTFAPAPTSYRDFTENNAFANAMRGAQILANPEFAMAIGGFVAAAKKAGDQLVPICNYGLKLFAQILHIVLSRNRKRNVWRIVGGLNISKTFAFDDEGCWVNI